MKYYLVLLSMLLPTMTFGQSPVHFLVNTLDRFNSPDKSCEEGTTKKKCPNIIIKNAHESAAKGLFGLDSSLQVCKSLQNPLAPSGFGYLKSDFSAVEEILEKNQISKLGGHEYWLLNCNNEIKENINSHNLDSLQRNVAFEYRHNMSKLNNTSKVLIQEMSQLNHFMKLENFDGIKCAEFIINDSQNFCKEAQREKCNKSNNREELISRALEVAVPTYKSLKSKRNQLLGLMTAEQTDKHIEQVETLNQTLAFLEKEFPYLSSEAFNKNLGNKKLSYKNIETALVADYKDRKQKVQRLLRDIQSAAACLTGHKTRGCGRAQKTLEGLPDFMQDFRNLNNKSHRYIAAEMQAMQCVQNVRQDVKEQRKDSVFAALTVAGGGAGLAIRGVAGAMFSLGRINTAMRARNLLQLKRGVANFAKTKAGALGVTVFGADIAYLSDSVQSAITSCQGSLIKTEKAMPTHVQQYTCFGSQSSEYRKYREDSSNCVMSALFAALDITPLVPLAVLTKIKKNVVKTPSRQAKEVADPQHQPMLSGIRVGEGFVKLSQQFRRHSGQHVVTSDEFIKINNNIKVRRDKLVELSKKANDPEINKQINQQYNLLYKDLKKLSRKGRSSSVFARSERNKVFEAIDSGKAKIKSNEEAHFYIRTGEPSRPLRSSNGELYEFRSYDDVLKKIKELNLKDAKIDQQKILLTTIEITDESGRTSRYKMAICTSKERLCLDDRLPGVRYKSDEAVTLYPICGPGVLFVPRLERIERCMQSEIIGRKKCKKGLEDILRVRRCH